MAEVLSHTCKSFEDARGAARRGDYPLVDASLDWQLQEEAADDMHRPTDDSVMAGGTDV